MKNWKKEFIQYLTDPVEIMLLSKPVTCSAQGMAVGALRKRYMKLKGLI